MTILCEWIHRLIAMWIWGWCNEVYGVHSVHSAHTLHTVHTVHNEHTLCTLHSVCTVHSVNYIYIVYTVYTLHTVHTVHSVHTVRTVHTLQLVQFCIQFTNNWHILVSNSFMCPFPCSPLRHNQRCLLCYFVCFHAFHCGTSCWLLHCLMIFDTCCFLF